ncbi:PilZ domain-containing protein [Sphingosinicella ginsenosidimutans]|uniref:PilZ domain-containing protein n=1 Tax=Allosphingosinicella ginsenosidimutans TaxID=1176539 RepID=A0A5C6TRV4_9SPHN|nr:PilZ domain-containing protein [Sphingosinicella ginsenosidimutans]TXC63093.1 PilZ domain-containing protein [Sphingosinicella ginsenosidimutans]
MLAQDRVEETSFSFSADVPLPPDRRHQDRHIKILRVGAIFVDGRRELCLIRNISAGGLMAHVYSSVRPGQHVTVELKTNQQVEGRVVWVREANAGVAFDHEVDIEELLANPAQLDNGWKARAPRVEVDRACVLRVGARTYRVRTRDISQSGIKIEFDRPIGSDTQVMVTPEDFRPVAGTVRWQQGGACGISFNQLVPLAELIAWLKRR